MSTRAGVALLALLALSGGARGDTEVALWAMGREGELVRSLVGAFEHAHPGVRVRVQQVPWNAAHEKLLTAFVGGALPDVFQLGSTWIPEFAALGALAPVDDAAGADGADVFPGLLDTNVVDGTRWGVPWYADTRVLFVRRDLLRAAGAEVLPVTWRDWLPLLERVGRGDGAERAALLLPLTEWQTPVALAFAHGATLLRDADGRGDFRSAPVREAFAFYVDLFRRGLARRDAATQLANLYHDFAAGRFVVHPTGPWNLGEFSRRVPADCDWGTVPLPAIDVGRPGVSVAGGASLVVSRQARDPELAWALVRHLTAPAQQCALYDLAGDLPVDRAAWRACRILERDDRVTAFWTQLATIRATPKIPEWERIAARITRHLERVVRGDVELDAALETLDADVDGILEKRRWLQQRGAP